MYKNRKFLITIISICFILIAGVSLLASVAMLNSKKNVNPEDASAAVDRYRSVLIASNITEVVGAPGRNMGWGTMIYDRNTNRTYIVYPAGKMPNGLSETAPYLASFDNKTEKVTERRIFEPAVKSDSHNYPQIFRLDQDDFAVMESYHANHNLHFSSFDGSNLVEIPDTFRATYGVAMPGNNALYYFYRDTLYPEGKKDQAYYVKGTQYYVKYDYDTKAWSKPIQYITYQRREEQFNNETINWNNTSVASILPMPKERHKLAILWSLRGNYGAYYGHNFFGIFNTKTDKLETIDGKEVGPKMALTLVEKKPTMSTAGSNLTLCLGFTAEGAPIIFATDLITDANGQQFYQLYNLRYLNGEWKKTVLNYREAKADRIVLWDSETLADGKIALYSSFRHEIKEIIYNPYTNNIDYTESIIKADANINRFVLTRDNNPKVKASYIVGNYTNWATPLATGKLYFLLNR